MSPARKSQQNKAMKLIDFYVTEADPYQGTHLVSMEYTQSLVPQKDGLIQLLGKSYKVIKIKINYDSNSIVILITPSNPAKGIPIVPVKREEG